jgi:hypothetical protein
MSAVATEVVWGELTPTAADVATTSATLST